MTKEELIKLLETYPEGAIVNISFKRQQEDSGGYIHSVTDWRPLKEDDVYSAKFGGNNIYIGK